MTPNQLPTDGATVLPDGSAFAVASLPLPTDHWLYAPHEYRDGEVEPVELPAPILNHQAHGETVRAAIRYAIRGATMCGKDVDFDPDALVQNAMYALCGPFGGNALAALAQQAQEPVGYPPSWAVGRLAGELGGAADPVSWGTHAPIMVADCPHHVAIYTTQPAPQVPTTHTDGWLQSGGLLYRLTDERLPKNRDEINVTMADGSRSEESRTRRAGELLDRIRSAPQPAPVDERDAEIAELRAEVLAWRKQCDRLTHQVICCGVAASHPDATLTTRGAYAGKWNSGQAEEVRKLRAERDALAALESPAPQAEGGEA